jgi:hypothetical protein
MERAREIYEYVRNIHLELNDWNSLSISQKASWITLAQKIITTEKELANAYKVIGKMVCENVVEQDD